MKEQLCEAAGALQFILYADTPSDFGVKTITGLSKVPEKIMNIEDDNREFDTEQKAKIEQIKQIKDFKTLKL